MTGVSFWGHLTPIRSQSLIPTMRNGDGNRRPRSRAIAGHADLLHQPLPRGGSARTDPERGPGRRAAPRRSRALEKVRRRFPIPIVRIAVGSAFALLVVIALTLSVNRYREPAAAPPEALAHIAEKNRDAAVIAAAHQRAESAASTNAAEDLADAQLRGANAAATANAHAGQANDDNRTEGPGRRD